MVTISANSQDVSHDEHQEPAKDLKTEIKEYKKTENSKYKEDKKTEYKTKAIKNIEPILDTTDIPPLKLFNHLIY